MDTHKTYFLTVISIVLSSFLLVFTLTKWLKSKALNLPPGPAGWPIVGNLFQVAFAGKPYIKVISDLNKKYGPIFKLQMGNRIMIFIASPELAHEAMIEKGQVFANRPTEPPTRTIFSSNKITVNSAIYGPAWRSLRRNMVNGMLSPARLREFYPIRQSAMERLICRLRTESSSNNGIVSVLQNIRFAVFCILLRMCFGVNMNEDDIVKIEDVLKRVLITIQPRMDDYLPLLGVFFSKQRKQALDIREDQLKLLIPFIQLRREILKDLNSVSKSDSFSYLDTLFHLNIEGRTKSPSDEELVTLCSELINGGTDTTATALEWGFARLIETPKMQQKIYDEIKSVVQDRKVDERDLEHMPYLNEFTKELLRRHPPSYFSLAHSVIEPAKLGGYDIPINASVEIYLPSLSLDPKIWNDPEKFDPDRFSTGREEADITGVKGIKMLPFGTGRRICPGLNMATLHINLILARMVQEFEWCLPPSVSKLDMSEKLEFTIVMNPPLKALIKPRK